ncbi:MAG: hypothetical protein ABFS46_05905 [Myxococcota bacterium]
MRRKWDSQDGPRRAGGGRVEADLLARGIAPEFCEACADRLAPLVASGSVEAYEAALDAVVLAYRNPGPGAEPTVREGELQQLMDGFVGELRKLEETMRTLDAYVTRMRTQASKAVRHQIH